ncbi:MAG: ABC transporter substrate-binding protein [Salaquimonas sp.]|nr:ABC transporter substrate-binding protein [Salaquimonas sp.]
MQSMKKLVAVAALALSAGLVSAGWSHAADTIKVGFIGSFASDAGRSTMRGAQIAIDELNAAGGVLGGKQIEMVKADTHEDVTEGIKAYEYLAETEGVDFIISGCIDDVSLGWLPRMTEYKIPTLDTWTSNIGIIDKLVEDYDTYKMYFMNVATDEALATLYVDFGKDILAKKMGWKKTIILQEDTAFGNAINGLVTQLLAPEAGIEVLDTIVYDTATVDFSPIFSRAVDSGADFIYLIASVNSQVVSSQYVKLQVPLAMTGVNVSALGQEYWDDTGGAGGGISTLSPVPSVGFVADPESQKFVDKYIAEYGNERPKYPHFNGFNAYWGIKQAFAAAEEAGGFGLDKWVPAMENQDLKLMKDGKLWLRYAFWKPGEVEERTQRTYPHNIRFDITPPYDDGAPSMVVIQWYENGDAKVVYPPKYATGEFEVPSWVKK